MKEEFAARMVRVHFGEDDRWHGQPLSTAILAQCRACQIEHVMVLRGIEGYGAQSHLRRPHHWSFSKDAPIQISIIGTEEQIARLMPALEEMVGQGLMASSPVHAIRLRED